MIEILKSLELLFCIIKLLFFICLKSVCKKYINSN